MSNWINLNGNLFPSGEVGIAPDNRAFRYGDSLFETIRMAYGKVQLLDGHFERLAAGMKSLEMEMPDDFSPERFRSEIEELCKMNTVNGDARIRLTVFRNEGGFYAPVTNSVSYLIEANPLSHQGYVLNSKGYTVDVFPNIKKPLNCLSGLKTANALIYVMGGVFKNKHGLDDCVIINEKGNICEAITSNLFVVKNGALYTPALEEGCVPGVMRQQVLRIARENRVAVYEISLLMNVLLNADELFLTNAVNGIIWVGAYKGKRYLNNTGKQFSERINAAARVAVPVGS
jgi:branched-subunit amino acid aminotransferase/4-amino-4-deoxychorismate lyase